MLVETAKVSRECVGHWMVERQRRAASFWPRWSAALMAAVIRGQQVEGGVERGRSRWLVKRNRCGARRGASFHVTDWALWAPVVGNGGITPWGVRRLFRALLAVGVAVGSSSRKWGVCLPVDLGGRERASGEDRGEWWVFVAGDDGFYGSGSCWACEESFRAGAAITAATWQTAELRLLPGDCRAGLKGECICYK